VNDYWLTTVNSTTPAHGKDDEEATSPPASTEVDDVDDDNFEAFTKVKGKAIEEYRGEGEDWDMPVNVDTADGIDLDAGVKEPVSL
jgi:hypothetical protein